MKLSDTQTQILAAWRARCDDPSTLEVAAREAVRKSLLAKGLLEAVEVDGVEEHETRATEAGPATYRLAA